MRAVIPTDLVVYLASQSPRRAQLLEQLGVALRPLLADANEDAESLEQTRAGEAPLDYVERVTRAKMAAAVARACRRGLPADALILCADTTVSVGRIILGKPADAADAARMLTRLSGRWHRVDTAVTVARGDRLGLVVQRSRVRVAPLTPTMIDAYVACGEPFGKAGGYAIQGRFAAHVERIDGSHSGIMGLPLFETAQLLCSLGSDD